MSATLINVKTNWVSSENYNFEDINKVEGNMDILYSYWNPYGFGLPTITTITNRNVTDRDNVASINRLEENLDVFRQYIVEPPLWGDKVTWDRDRPFDYRDANRWEKNMELINQWAQNVVDEFKYCGTFYAGEGIIL